MSKILKFEWYKTKSRKIIPKVSAVFVVWGVYFPYLLNLILILCRMKQHSNIHFY